MATRQEIIAAVHEADARVNRMSTDILAHGETPLLEGTWRVRDCLSHIAARSTVTNVVRNMLNRIHSAERGQTLPQASIDDINHGQIVERQGLSVEELLQQIKDGHATALKELPAITDETLNCMVPNIRGVEASIGDGVLRNLTGHERLHMDIIDAAIKAAKAR